MERGSKCGEAEKGETLQVKVTVKDAQGNPLGDMPFTLKRGDGYTRSNEKHIAGSGDALVAPVVINSGPADETSLNDTAAAYSAMTGSDGTKILTITRPDTHGTKTSLTAALYSDTTKKRPSIPFLPLSPARTAIKRKCGGICRKR